MKQLRIAEVLRQRRKKNRSSTYVAFGDVRKVKERDNVESVVHRLHLVHRLRGRRGNSRKGSSIFMTSTQEGEGGKKGPKHAKYQYRVAHLVVDLGWVQSDFEHCNVCPVLPWLMEIWQKGLGNWARWWNTEIQVNPTQVRHQMGHLVHILRTGGGGGGG